MAVAQANLAHIQAELGATLLDYAPYEQVRDCRQSYDSRAISFKLLFGYVFDKHSNKRQEVWVLHYPPTQEGRHAEVQFHSIHRETGEFVKHDDSNISNTISALADAFNNPKKAAKSKHVALAKYYYLKALAAKATKSGRASELKISIPITRTFTESLRVVCREFEVEAKEKLSEMLSQSSSATLVDDNDSDLSDPPEDLMEPGSIITPEISPIPIHDTHAQRFEILQKIRDEEEQLRASDSAIKSQLTELELARREIEGDCRVLQEKLRSNDEKKDRIAARREDVFKGMSFMAVFELGGEMERKGDLEDQKNRVRAEKMRLQVQLDRDEHLDFGLEAGRRMETKRRRWE